MVKRDRLPKPTDRRAEFLDTWAEPDGRLGIELNDRGTIYAILLQVKKADLHPRCRSASTGLAAWYDSWES